ncbi:protoporphyrinogen/coproporphyrinogen oxidase [Aeromonas allosaccharophila]|uniref:protoporphyrinogen/coproporphyrinogen oxidase n=1 Tax=Aeromonas allosaccharophila TaxID=656 RepID=UPI003D1E60D0
MIDSNNMARVVVLGGGVAGISAAYHLKNGMAGDVVCYEANSTVGGLLSNFSISGFRFDNAVHLSFTKDEYVKAMFSKTEHYSHAPDSSCYENGVWLRHPIQNNLYPLPIEDKVSLISSFYDAPKECGDNYSSWLVSQYGSALAERYPIKYTLKYWGIDASRLSLTWIGDRVRKADVGEILRGAFEARVDNHYYANEMRYPKQGGYFSFIKPMLEEIDIRLNKKAVSIDLSVRSVTFADGEVVFFDKFINTIPLPELIRIIDGVPTSVKAAAESLLYTTIDLISVGFSKVIESKNLWFYIYTDTLAARAYSPSLKSPDSVPAGASSLQFEIYNLSTSEPIAAEAMIADVRNYLLKSKLCSEHDILFLHHKKIPYGNVVYDHEMEARRQIVLDYLDENKIVTAGRFGEWSYLWSDQALISGKVAAEKVR